MTGKKMTMSSLRELIETCRRGEFYEDHDASMELLAAAEVELDLIEELRRFKNHHVTPPYP